MSRPGWCWCALPFLWYGVTLVHQATNLIEFPMAVAITAAGAAVLLELISGDVSRRLELIGLAAGLALGLILIVAASLLGRPAAMSTDRLLWANLSLPTMLIWNSALFFPERIARKAGVVGLLIWGIATVILFGVLLALYM